MPDSELAYRAPGTYCGPVDVSHLGELGLAVRDGHLEVAFPPLDANDQVIRYSIPNTQSDIGVGVYPALPDTP